MGYQRVKHKRSSLLILGIRSIGLYIEYQNINPFSNNNLYLLKSWTHITPAADSIYLRRYILLIYAPAYIQTILMIAVTLIWYAEIHYCISSIAHSNFNSINKILGCVIAKCCWSNKVMSVSSQCNCDEITISMMC